MEFYKVAPWGREAALLLLLLHAGVLKAREQSRRTPVSTFTASPLAVESQTGNGSCDSVHPALRPAARLVYPGLLQGEGRSGLGVQGWLTL